MPGRGRLLRNTLGGLEKKSEQSDFYPEKNRPPQVPCLQAPDEPLNSRGSGVSGSGSPGSFALKRATMVWPIPAGKLIRTAPNRNGVDSGGLSLLALTPQRPDSSLRSVFPPYVCNGTAEDSAFGRLLAQDLLPPRFFGKTKPPAFEDSSPFAPPFTSYQCTTPCG